jgi:opacity protein-like surface antigen
VAVAVTMAACATNAFAQTDGAQTDGKNYALFQVGATNGENLALGADFAQVINRFVDVYVVSGWQDEAPAGFRDTLHVTGGVKLVLLRSFVRPYILAGAGGMHFRQLKDVDDDKDFFLGEVGAGLAFPVGSQGHIDVGYRYFAPYNGPSGFTPHGVFAGFGLRY